MRHPASHLSLTLHSRSDGHSAVAAAAYRARTSYVDQRRGRRYTYRSRSGLLSHELIGWKGASEALWNAAKAAETRCNARVARELRPALPSELPLDVQVRLVRGMCLWLRDRYGVACQANIHAPNFHDPDEEKALWARVAQTGVRGEDLAILSDASKTNLNFHAHILITTRRVDSETREFQEKTRALDDRKLGPEELKTIRNEWEKRTNAALKKVGSSSRIDMRSNADMAAAGDAPGGLLAQEHLGPRRIARQRRKLRETGKDDTVAGRHRETIKAHNRQLWTSWLHLRALEREKAREEESAHLAATREVERRQTAEAARERIRTAQTPEKLEAAAIAANHMDSLLRGRAMTQAIAWAQKPGSASPADPEEKEIDLEALEMETSPQRQRVRVRQRVRGD